MKVEGKILNWNDAKGYGFVDPVGGGERAFVHIKAFIPRSRRPVNGEHICYKLVLAPDNRYRAANIAFVSDVKRMAKNNQKRTVSTTIAIFSTLLFSFILVSSVLARAIPLIFAGGYLLLSIITFCVYAIDKSASQSKRWRTKENTLHLLSLVGGWPGALLAQTTLRHKSRKHSFQVVYLLTMLMNISAFIWCHTQTGQAFINTLAQLLPTSITFIS